MNDESESERFFRRANEQYDQADEVRKRIIRQAYIMFGCVGMVILAGIVMAIIASLRPIAKL